MVCLEDVNVLVLDKANYSSVADLETNNDLRANSMCKERLQKLSLEKFSKMTAEEATASQNKYLKRLGAAYKDIDQVFNKKKRQHKIEPVP